MKNIAKSLTVLLAALLFLAGCDQSPLVVELEEPAQKEVSTEIKQTEKETSSPSNDNHIKDAVDSSINEDRLPSIDHVKQEPDIVDSDSDVVERESDVIRNDDASDESEPAVSKEQECGSDNTAVPEEAEGKETEENEPVVVLPVKVILDGVRVQLADGREGPYINCAWLDGVPLELVDGCAEIKVDRFDVDHVLRVAYISDYGDFQITFADVTTMVNAEPGKDVRISGSVPETTVSVQFVPTLVIE